MQHERLEDEDDDVRQLENVLDESLFSGHVQGQSVQRRRAHECIVRVLIHVRCTEDWAAKILNS